MYHMKIFTTSDFTVGERLENEVVDNWYSVTPEENDRPMFLQVTGHVMSVRYGAKGIRLNTVIVITPNER